MEPWYFHSVPHRLIRSKLCPFFILATWIVAAAVSSPYLFAVKLVENSGRMQCDRNAGWKEAFGEFSSFSDFAIVIYILFIYIPVLLLVILYSIILNSRHRYTQVNIRPTLKNYGKEETEACFICPLLSFQCLCFAGYHS